jgi:hypothetical protein
MVPYFDTEPFFVPQISKRFHSKDFAGVLRGGTILGFVIRAELKKESVIYPFFLECIVYC